MAWFALLPQTGRVCYQAFSTDSITVGSAAGATASTAQLASTASSATNTFNALLTTARQFRPVAACLKFTNYTSEANITGIMSYQSPVQADVMIPSSSELVTPAHIRGNLGMSTRMPDALELIWRPDRSGEDWTAVVNGVVQLPVTNNGSVCGFLLNGMDANTKYQVEVVMIFEYAPVQSLGIMGTAKRPKSKNTLDQVLNAVPDSVFDGGIKAFKRIGRAM